MVRVAILGATGYTAGELLRILLRHPHVQVTALTSRQQRRPIDEVHPALRGRIDLPCEDLTPQEIAERAECVFCALPHGASFSTVPALLEQGCRVIDLSADYRLRDPDVYREWYGLEHGDPGRLGDAVYGLPELPTLRSRIPEARLIANPGCYTSTSILALAPLVAEDLVRREGIVIDAKSGVSGAGRTPKLHTLFCECNESVAAYGVGRHRHTPEIEQVLGDVAGTAVRVVFTPHLIPMDRGIFATIYTDPLQDRDESHWLDTYRRWYADRPFVRVTESLPATKDVTGTNFFDVSVRRHSGKLVVLACLDNLIKGAAGVAVQNFNLMYGFDETLALL